jgi:tetratricopeptide (TPR) repeat protein
VVDASVAPPDLAAPPEDLAPAAPQEEVRGFLVVEAPPLVQFAIDHGHFQTASKQPIHLAVGPHQVVSLSGPQKIEIKENETLTVQVEESAVEKLVASGLEAAERKDYRKAQKALDKASGICSRERKYPQPCNELAIEAFYQLGVINQAQDKFSDAMNDYQQVVELSGSSKGRQERKTAAQRAMSELLPSLGQVVIPKKVKKRCQEVTLYMLPGTHQIDIDGESQTVKVRAQETIRLGSCQ